MKNVRVSCCLKSPALVLCSAASTHLPYSSTTRREVWRRLKEQNDIQKLKPLRSAEGESSCRWQTYRGCGLWQCLHAMKPKQQYTCLRCHPKQNDIIFSVYHVEVGYVGGNSPEIQGALLQACSFSQLTPSSSQLAAELSVDLENTAVTRLACTAPSKINKLP
jgi:hypothetical protein